MSAGGGREVNLSTIGFTKTSAERFFGRLRDADVRRVIDVRLNNTSQLAGFAKVRDIEFFLETLGGIGYCHEPLLAPSQAIFAAYKKLGGSWAEFERRFLGLMEERKIETRLDPGFFDRGCLLCSEATARHCHRRLVAEYLADRWDTPIQITHL